MASYKSFDQILDIAAKQACEFMREEFYETINFFLAQYYSEWHPTIYQRSYDMLHSAFKTEVKKVGKTWQCAVGIDYESLDSYKDASGFDVVNFANQGLHGGMDVGTDTHIWDDPVDAAITSGQMIKDVVTFLKSKGYNVIL